MHLHNGIFTKYLIRFLKIVSDSLNTYLSLGKTIIPETLINSRHLYYYYHLNQIPKLASRFGS